MSALRLGVGVDGATHRLICAARATQATEGVPKESARALVALARGVRLYLEARQDRLARATLDDIDKLMAGADEPLLVAAYGDLIQGVRKALGWPTLANSTA